MSLSFDSALQAQTVTDSAFAVYDGVTERKLAISKSVYLPQEKMVYLTVTASETPAAACRVALSDALRNVNGEALTAAEADGVFVRTYEAEAYGMSVKSVKVVQNGAEVLCPEGTLDEEVRVRVINASDTEQTKTLLLYLNERSEAPFISESVTVSGRSEQEFVYDISGRSWSVKDSLCAALVS